MQIVKLQSIYVEFQFFKDELFLKKNGHMKILDYDLEDIVIQAC